MNFIRFALPLGLLALSVLPGCIVQDIRDNLNKANASLPEVDGRIAQTSSALSTTNTHLEGIDTNLGTTVTGLSQTNEQIKSIEANLAKTNQSLEVVERNLVQVNHHLAGLRTTISKLDSTIPFLDLGGDMPIEEPSTAAPAATSEPAKDIAQDAVASPDAVPADAPVSAAATNGTRDSLAGPWISADPNRTFTLVLLASGKYVREYTDGSANNGAGGQMLRSEQGTWKREGSGATLKLLLTPFAQTNPAQPGQTIAPTYRYDVLHQSSRSMCLQIGDRLIVLKKP